MKREIFYWGPFLDNVATVTAILNSSKSINKYSKKYSSKIINAIGEWNGVIKENPKRYVGFSIIGGQSKLQRK